MKVPVATKKGGMCTGMPNVCFIPAPPPVERLPMPFPSIGLLASAKAAVDTVLVEHKEPVVEGDKMDNSKGDEAGTKGGVVSGVSSKEVVPDEFASNVFFKGKKPFVHTGRSKHNGSNANLPVGVHSVPSQAKVLVRKS